MMQCRNLTTCHDLFCRMCGTVSGDVDDLTGKRTRFKLIDPEPGTMRATAICTTCYEGVVQMQSEKPSWLSTFVKQHHNQTIDSPPTQS